jgi:UDP-N-acetylglucosamine diphosphorylase/glucosamine-1-phosphate N-acetyltransferase
MNLILFDDASRVHLLPLTFVRPVAELRLGILTIREKWEKKFGLTASFLTEGYLQARYPLITANSNILIAGSVLPDDQLFDAIRFLPRGEALTVNGELIAAHDPEGDCSISIARYVCHEYKAPLLRIRHLWDIFSLNGKALEADFDELTKGRKSFKPDETNRIIGERFFLEEGATISCSVINTQTGAVYLGRNAEIWEGCMVRGGLAMCEDSSLKMGAKIYGPTTIGPGSRVGGEVSNCVILGYSNKGHDGFLGNSVLGEWCNLGADTNNSNLKNNYGIVQLYDYAEARPVSTGLQFCGLIMGDHSKCGINTMFNTGTVTGVGANIFGGGFPPKHIPSFAWGGFDNSVYQIDKAIETARIVYQRRNKIFDHKDEAILRRVFELTVKTGE